MKQIVAVKFPDNNRPIETAIGGYLFLRFFNPALVVPDGIDIKVAGDLTAENRRTLLLISKILQNLSNGVEFQKEEYMKPFNPYVKEKFDAMKEYFDQAAVSSHWERFIDVSLN